MDSHLALFSIHATRKLGGEVDEEIIDLLDSVEIPDGDSLLRRIRERVVSSKP